MDYIDLEAGAKKLGVASASSLRRTIERAASRILGWKPGDSVPLGGGWEAIKLGSRKPGTKIDARPWRLRKIER